ncbi:hypothetical protein, partial [Faecalibacterium duncaniae]|uniref:hypothetical protein n=1 Tax=Faecalibacterium duncaniae (strain DSM 17677 / JCM 31915 / A2-165) TaxID=411483 RepID=UPI00293FC75D
GRGTAAIQCGPLGSVGSGLRLPGGTGLTGGTVLGRLHRSIGLLPHLGAEQNARPLKDGIKAEELNILIGSDAVDDENVKEAVK